MVNWTKGHFEKVAKIVDETIKEQEIKDKVCKKFTDEFSKENPRFNKDKFLFACGGWTKN